MGENEQGNKPCGEASRPGLSSCPIGRTSKIGKEALAGPVIPRVNERWRCYDSYCNSPVTICAGAAMDVRNTRFLRVMRQIYNPRVVSPCHRVDWHLLDIAGDHKIFK